MNIEFAREQMVQQQIRAWDVLDETVLETFRTTPRELFVPHAYESVAFAETEIPIGHGEHMLAPVIEGRILQALELAPGDRVLEVGTGTGFHTACMARLADRIVSIDIHEDFIRAARERFDKLGIANVELAVTDGMAELPEGPFDAVVVGGSVERFDQRFVDVLAPGGRLFLVVGSAPMMEARLVTRGNDSDWQSEVLFETELKPLVNSSEPEAFRF